MQPSTEHNNRAQSHDVIRLPIKRVSALLKGCVWLASAAVLGTFAVHVYAPLSFAPAPSGSLLVTGSVLCIALPLPVGAVITAWIAGRWLLLAGWPAWIGIVAQPHELEIALGPLGNKRYDTDRLTVRYPMDLADEDDAGYEAYLPEEEQLSSFVPTLIHPEAKTPLHRLILRRVGVAETEVAGVLRPMFVRWRQRTLDVEQNNERSS